MGKFERGVMGEAIVHDYGVCVPVDKIVPLAGACRTTMQVPGPENRKQ